MIIQKNYRSVASNMACTRPAPGHSFNNCLYTQGEIYGVTIRYLVVFSAGS